MGHKNYSNFSKHFKKQNNVNEVVSNNEEPIEGQITIDEVVNNEVENVEVAEPVVETVVGFVSGCDRLNMRKEASKTAEVVTILHKYAELQIDKAKSTEEFYKVTTLAGIEGYCMKKFISVR